MGKLRWYKRDPDAALAGMAELTLVERGAYNSIIDLLYSRDGNVSDDDVLVARMIGCHWREWKAAKGRLIARGKIRLEGGKITANRVQETLREAADFSQDQRRRAARRWHKPEKHNENNGDEIPPGNANTTTTTTTTTEPIAKAIGATAKGNGHGRTRKPRTRLPPDWQPSEAGWQCAIEHECGPDTPERDKFVNHHTAHGKVMADWDAAWRTWCGNAADFRAASRRGAVGTGRAGEQSSAGGIVESGLRVAARRGLL